MSRTTTSHDTPRRQTTLNDVPPLPDDCGARRPPRCPLTRPCVASCTLTTACRYNAEHSTVWTLAPLAPLGLTAKPRPIRAHREASPHKFQIERHSNGDKSTELVLTRVLLLLPLPIAIAARRHCCCHHHWHNHYLDHSSDHWRSSDDHEMMMTVTNNSTCPMQHTIITVNCRSSNDHEMMMVIMIGPVTATAMMTLAM